MIGMMVYLLVGKELELFLCVKDVRCVSKSVMVVDFVISVLLMVWIVSILFFRSLCFLVRISILSFLRGVLLSWK